MENGAGAGCSPGKPLCQCWGLVSSSPELRQGPTSPLPRRELKTEADFLISVYSPVLRSTGISEIDVSQCLAPSGVRGLPGRILLLRHKGRVGFFERSFFWPRSHCLNLSWTPQASVGSWDRQEPGKQKGLIFAQSMANTPWTG